MDKPKRLWVDLIQHTPTSFGAYRYPTKDLNGNENRFQEYINRDVVLRFAREAVSELLQRSEIPYTAKMVNACMGINYGEILDRELAHE